MEISAGKVEIIIITTLYYADGGIRMAKKFRVVIADTDIGRPMDRSPANVARLREKYVNQEIRYWEKRGYTIESIRFPGTKHTEITLSYET